jgi:fermentation-respiration switch protein FrsA (DUF1100 family)
MLLFSFAGLVIFGAVSWFVGSRLVAPANQPVFLPEIGVPLEEHIIQSESGNQLAAWYAPKAESSGTIVLLHPLRGNRQSMIGRAKLFYEAGFSILMIDFQGHGESPGENITFGHLEKHDADAAVKYASELNPDDPIGVVGWSLGGAAVLLSSPNDVDALVLESVFPTIEEAVYNRIGLRLAVGEQLLGSVLLWQIKPRLGFSPSELRPIDFIGEIGCPVLVAAGDKDLHTPIEETNRLFSMANQPKKLVVFEGASHVDLLRYDQEMYDEEIVGFMEQHLDQGGR